MSAGDWICVGIVVACVVSLLAVEIVRELRFRAWNRARIQRNAETNRRWGEFMCLPTRQRADILSVDPAPWEHENDHA